LLAARDYKRAEALVDEGLGLLGIPVQAPPEATPPEAKPSAEGTGAPGTVDSETPAALAEPTGGTQETGGPEAPETTP